MNDNIKAILIKISKELLKLGWKLNRADTSNIEVFDGEISLFKNYPHGIDSSAGIELSIKSEDNINYYPVFKVDISVFVQGVGGHDETSTFDSNIVFKDNDVNNIEKILSTAKQIDSTVNSHVDDEYRDFKERNAAEINYYTKYGWKADQGIDR